MTSFYRIVYYVPALFPSGGIPAGALVVNDKSKPLKLVRPHSLPDEKFFAYFGNGQQHLATLGLILDRLEQNPTTMYNLGDHMKYGDSRTIPPSRSEPDVWLRDCVLPGSPIKALQSQTTERRAAAEMAGSLSDVQRACFYLVSEKETGALLERRLGDIAGSVSNLLFHARSLAEARIREVKSEDKVQVSDLVADDLIKIMPEKLKIHLDDPETRAVWDTVKKAQEEVASWPAWKRGDLKKL